MDLGLRPEFRKEGIHSFQQLLGLFSAVAIGCQRVDWLSVCHMNQNGNRHLQTRKDQIGSQAVAQLIPIDLHELLLRDRYVRASGYLCCHHTDPL
jgi:hypothetical protein